ncbi:MAG: deoxynucleoside kinase [Oscillospiraceae bacterium]|nr:deoxynucleoside kinase [Oscillospiraceae bacterium]
MGKLIVLEGTDGSGKSTQFELLKRRMEQEGTAFRTIVFPQYQEPSSALIRMYLGGEFGENPNDVNAYAASTFYAVDRYASYRKAWGEYYQKGGLILSDRYTSSNAVHQASKLPAPARPDFYRWLYDLEFIRFGLPTPDLVLYLDMPTELTEQLMRRRENSTHTHADIHEKDLDYLRLCRKTGLEAAAYYGWRVVSCARDGAVRGIEEIHEEIYRNVKANLDAVL